LVAPERTGVLGAIQVPAGRAPRKFEFLSDAVSQLAFQLLEGGIVVPAIRFKRLEGSQVFDVDALRPAKGVAELLSPLIGWNGVRQRQRGKLERRLVYREAPVGVLQRASDDLEELFGPGAEIVVKELVRPGQVEQAVPQSFIETFKPLLLIWFQWLRHFVAVFLPFSSRTDLPEAWLLRS
jgi:hypothetical protein